MNLIRRSIFLGFAISMPYLALNAQTSFVKYEGNPVLSPGVGQTSAGFPFLYLLESQDSMKVFFTAATGSAVSNNTIGLASTEDGISFIINNLNLLEHGTASDFDSEGVFGASVLYDGTEYKMWYNGYNTQPYYMGKMEVGLATSMDGIVWQRNSSLPVLSVGASGSWDDTWAYQSSVIFEDGIYRMYYTGYDGSLVGIGIASSSDGITWIKEPGNPIYSASKSTMPVQNPRVLHTSNGYEMWFNSANSVSGKMELFYTSSQDGLSWNNETMLVMQPGSAGSFDSQWVWHPMILVKDGVYHMWYSGYNNNEWSVGYASDSTSIGINGPDNNSTMHQLVLSMDRSSKVLSISLKENQELSGMIQILDSAGRLIQSEIVKEFPVRLNLSAYLPGVYHVRFIPSGSKTLKQPYRFSSTFSFL